MVRSASSRVSNHEAPENEDIAGFNRMRVQVNFFKPINVIWVVQSFAEKYFAFRFPQISVINIASRPTERGVSRSSRTLVRDAMDAAVSTDE